MLMSSAEMTLLRSTPADRIPPWGKRVVVEDKFDLGDRGVVLQLAIWVPGTGCRVRLDMPGRPAFAAMAGVARPAGDGTQAALLIRGLLASEIPEGTIVELLEPNDG
jgi:hypothetical protein